jgi:thiosulfate/3-mercaptopyruvate sulfurtransferase
MFTTLIDAPDLHDNIADPAWIIVDCRFVMADTAAGRNEYQASHIPGAIYAHLDEDLSNPPATDNGRHPLPAPAVLRERFGQMGIDGSKQVVAYDNANGAYAARLWWLLRYMGHDAVAVLDGGWAAWQAAGFSVSSGVEEQTAVPFKGNPRTEWLVTADAVPSAQLLVDSRAAPRYRGEVEPLDPVAGHIPGAKNYFYQRNWDDNGRYLSATAIKAQLREVLGETRAEEAVFYCGSGVTACVNLLALASAEMGNGRLYAGSWSDWCSDPARPIAVSQA